eukprot:CAMPEP_0197304078 /NCGR_PEP_ID=MMETSP0890-20130614/52051_1 /TAXON_ID=44058 ORGANISM="Aureoumbra lagunensis, Strain CCMP1510" /NCGR_SAMPLE_ID=MMETSP0890 /ASSEMBLY_ACC=CAM_ASM_000533 /LENGTH=472 /DNA_ID=CAMNT_0042784043 /DNA_START=186 /DNA_END=1604 /DNA_ORIENTATION=+
MESLRAIVDESSISNPRNISPLIYLSVEAEWVLRRCHRAVAGKNGKASVSAAADEARRYELWKYENIDDFDALMARLSMLGRASHSTPCSAETFVELVRCPPSRREEFLHAEDEKKRQEEEKCDRALLALEADSSHRAWNYQSWETYRKLLIGELDKVGDQFAQASIIEKTPPQNTTRKQWKLSERELYFKKSDTYYNQRLDSLRASSAANEAARALQEKAKRRPDSYAMARRCLEPFTPEEEARIEDALHQPYHALVVEGFNADILGEHTERLNPGKWLVDEIINFYFNLLQQRDKALCEKYPNYWISSHFFSSFFITKLLGDDARTYQYSGVRRWTKRFDIFQKRFVFVPVNVGNMHWTLLRFDMQNREIRYFDSMGSTGTNYLRAALRYLQDEYQDKKKVPMPDPSSWTLTPTTDNTPRQLNGYDCGVFTIFCAHYNSLDGIEPDFSQPHIPHLRKRIMLAIIDKHIPF